jgi:hypothetical protein
MSWVAGNRQADSHLGQAAYVSLNAEGGEEKSSHSVQTAG